MFEYTTGRFVAVNKITGCSIYQKNGEIRVAIDIDVKASEKNCVYTTAFADMQAADRFCKSIPVNGQQ